MAHRPLHIACLAAAGLAALAGCAAQDRLGAGASAIDGYGLHYVDDAQTAKLAYGRENSDAVGLMLECAKGSGQVEISDVSRSGESQLSLIAGGRRSDLKGEVQPGQGKPVIYTTTRASSPALQGFRRTGKVEVRTTAIRYLVVADETQKPMVDRFFAACGTA